MIVSSSLTQAFSFDESASGERYAIYEPDETLFELLFLQKKSLSTIENNLKISPANDIPDPPPDTESHTECWKGRRHRRNSQ